MISNKEIFVKKSKLIHENNFDYSKFYYTGAKNKSILICKQCYLDDKVIKKDNLLNIFNITHGYRYSYNLENFKNLHSMIEIICKNNHKFIQKASNHLQGKGCPICRESFGERSISIYLESNNINYVKQKTFDSCKKINKLPFDFYLPEHNICIEYDGIQHFKPIEWFGGKYSLDKIKIRDEIKTNFCKENNIKLIRISYKDDIPIKLSIIKKLITLQS